jgi:acyl-CoA reductase-like NAD-dependent aldehyde dehydrogenase
VVSGIFAATGQTCIAGSRALIHRSIHNEFVDKLVALGETARMGDPLLDTTQVGPITTRPQFKKVLDYIEIAKSEGASCVLGGGKAVRPECGEGWFVEPTVYTGVKPEMRSRRRKCSDPSCR